MDLVIVSMRLFEDGIDDFVKFTFQALRDVAGLKADVLEADEEISLKKAPMVNARQRAKALFYGYVSPGDLSDGTRLKQHFYDLQREANTQLFGTQPPGPISRVGARIYKDWEAAERSYEFSFRQLAKALGITAGKQGDDDE